MLEYNRTRAVAYAHKWAFGRNPAYLNFDDYGGDCTNFTSQVILAGSGIMNFTPIYGWYYKSSYERTASWTGVQYLYNFLTTNKVRGPVAEETDIKNIKPGDLIQLSFKGGLYTHSPVIVQVGEVPALNNILIAAHTYDADYRPLNTYQFEKCRCLHIKGILS